MSWRRNLYAVTAAGFIGFTGFTLVMPFLPLYFAQLGVTDVGEIALWSGLSLGVTPGVTAIMAPFWGRLADRYGRKIMVQRSLASFVVVMAAMAFATEPWHVFTLRAVQGLFAGYGMLTIAMAADVAPRDKTAYAIGFVQTAQRIGPAVGPVIGGLVAEAVGLRHAFFVTASFYVVALAVVSILYDERGVLASAQASQEGRVTFRSVLAFENFVLLMAVVFALQVVDRSFGPVLPLFVSALGTDTTRVPLIAGLLFSLAAGAGAVGNRFAGWLIEHHGIRTVIAGASAASALSLLGFLIAGGPWWLALPTTLLGVGIGAATTTAYTAATAVVPVNARGSGLGLLSSASLVGLAVSPIASGLLAATSIRAVFLVDAAILGVLAVVVSRLMITAPLPAPSSPPATEEV